MSPKVDLSNLLTLPHAAKILGITRQAVSVAIARKRIKVLKIDHIRLIPRASLEQYKKDDAFRQAVHTGIKCLVRKAGA
ncbi:MAG: helix-turn-helix domain-containing protein [Deltaproteobacteria bacterium]|nr:helix-turn-helix domain-containing protein [Deltaproteobacteria bacterium]